MSITGPEYALFDAGDLPLEAGGRLPAARLAYRSWGRVGEVEPILTCSAFGQSHADLAFIAGPGAPLDPRRHWIIHTELIGNGRSSSPSNTAPPLNGPAFPQIGIRDNVALQARLLDHLGVDRVAAVIGASMGGQQALQWAVSHPERVRRAVAIVASARASWHVQLFLHALETALRSDPAFAEGHYQKPPRLGLSRMSEAWAPWALSPEFFSLGHYRTFEDTSAATLEDFLARWRTRYHDRDANDLICHFRCWRGHDLGGTPGCGGDLEAAAARATLPVLLMPSSTDAYFAVADVAREAALFPEAQLQVIESPAGHGAGFGRMATDREQIRDVLTAFLEGA
ncbi:MAG: alpha/beta fold hydrolase [Pseudomonadales bacterium]|jgi:homoserine O-acetyltransferase|nr:alpha/beta fold hydrolase [Pseudomonadales bacterium]